MNKKMSWWDKAIHEGQHTVFRVLSLIFSAASAWAIYWFFSALGDDAIQHFITLFTSAGFIALGYFVTRGLAYRMMTKQPVGAYIPLLVLYMLVEVSCNFGHAVSKYPDVAWIHQLTGWQLGLFSVVLPLVLSIIPLFNWALARVDVDLLQEKQGLYAQPKQAAPGYGGNGFTAQLGYPPMPPLTSRPQAAQKQPVPNALGNWFQNRGKQPPAQAPQQLAATNGTGGYYGNGIP